MNIEHLRYFLVVAQTKSINQAAQKLFVSQQHLSRILNNLEKQLNTTLLKRSSMGIMLTAKGEVFLKYAKKIISDYKEMEEYFYLGSLPPIEKNASVKGQCKVSFPFFFSLFLGEFIQQFKERYPAIQISWSENSYVISPEMLVHSDGIHLVTEELSTAKWDNKHQFVAYAIGETNISICVNRHSPLAYKNSLTKEDLEHQVQTHYPNTVFYDDIDSSNILFTSSNIHQHLESVIYNQSICVVPNYIHSSISKSYSDIVLIPFEHNRVIPINIVHSSDYQLTEADKVVMHFIAQYLREISVVTV